MCLLQSLMASQGTVYSVGKGTSLSNLTKQLWLLRLVEDGALGNPEMLSLATSRAPWAEI